jgi:putative sterol carrier protein
LRHKHPAVVMLSVAGFPEDSVFDQLSSWSNFVFRKALMAEIYRAGAETLTVPLYADQAKAILGAARQAGRELVESGKVSPETMARVKQPLHDNMGIMHQLGNLMWKTCIAEGVTPKEFNDKGLIPRPDSIAAFMMVMPMGFNPEGAGDTRAIMQFNFSGDMEGACHFRIADGKMEAFPGVAANPHLTIETPFALWMDIMTGKADGQQMFMAQKYKVHGDLSLLLRMKQFFQKSPAPEQSAGTAA